MKTQLSFFVAGIFLAALGTGFGQSTLQFSASTYTVAENAGTARLSVRRLNDTNAVLGTPTNNTLSITHTDAGVQFVLTDSSVAEDVGAVQFGVVRCDDGTLPVTVDFVTTDVNATNGLDYTGITTTLSFAPTERWKLVSVPILNDGITEATKTFRVTLSNPAGGLLGVRTTTTVSILDNDPGLGFESASDAVWEGVGDVNLIVLRGNHWDLGPITVDYVTSDLTATAGADYQALSGTLETIQTWADYNGASNPVSDPTHTLDLTTDVAGLDTVVTRYTTFQPSGAVELWTTNGAGHVPTRSSQFSSRVIDWLLAHPKP